jgi:hypothetical protein
MKKMLFCTFAITLLVSSYASAAPKNMALELKSDPNSFFAAPDNPVFHEKLGNTFTAEAWIFPTDFAGERMIVNKEDTYEFAVRNNGGFETALAAAGLAWDWHASGLKVEKDKWSHVAVTWDGKVVLMFVNGKKAGGKKDIAGKGLKITGSTFKVGRRERGGDTHSIFDGLIDEVRISKDVRYDVEKKGFMPDGKFKKDAKTVALWHFDEPSGTRKFSDASDNAYHLVGVGGARTSIPLAVEPHEKLTTTWGRLKQ